MFESWISNPQVKQEIEAEKRNAQLTREITSIQTTAQDQQYIEEQNRKSDLLLWQQSLSVDSLRHQLRSEYYDDKEGKWIKKQTYVNGKLADMAPLMTEEGIQMVEIALSQFLDENAKNLINSNLDEQRILNLLKYTSKDITHAIEYNYDKYVIDFMPSRGSLIKRIIKNSMLPTAFRSINGWTKVQDNLVNKRIETFNDSANNERKKLLGFI